MAVAWSLARGVVCRACGSGDELLVFSSFSGAAHVVANVGHLVVDLCRQEPQTMDELLRAVAEAFDADQPEDLESAAHDAIRQLESLGILMQCAPPH
jgi:PqqD family protein of HPr-rel-A system